MTSPSAERRIRRQILDLLERVPSGRVVTVDLLAQQVGALPQIVVTLLANLGDDERARVPWHRAVAKGGAIGRGPNRDAQFARLVREGVPVSPAGIVQDMARSAVADFAVPRQPPLAVSTATETLPPPLSRSRGMKDRPG